MPLCTTCMDWYSIPSGRAKTCRSCEGKMLLEAAREVDSKSMSIASLCSWIVFQRQPLKYRAAWRIG